jgi:hypothetical protein
LGRSPPVDSNELFDIATSFASGEEAMGAIFDGKKGKRTDEAPTEGSKSKELHRKDKPTMARPLLLTPLDGALDRPLEVRGFSTTC